MMVGGREKDSEEKHYRIFRLLLTDSGHYTLPTIYNRPIALLQPGGGRGESNDTANVNNLIDGNNHNKPADSSEAKMPKFNGNGDLVSSHSIPLQPVQVRYQPDSLRSQHDASSTQPIATTSTHDLPHTSPDSVQPSFHSVQEQPDPLPSQQNQQRSQPDSAQHLPDPHA